MLTLMVRPRWMLKWSRRRYNVRFLCSKSLWHTWNMCLGCAEETEEGWCSSCHLESRRWSTQCVWPSRVISGCGKCVWYVCLSSLCWDLLCDLYYIIPYRLILAVWFCSIAMGKIIREDKWLPRLGASMWCNSGAILKPMSMLLSNPVGFILTSQLPIRWVFIMRIRNWQSMIHRTVCRSIGQMSCVTLWWWISECLRLCSTSTLFCESK